MPVRGFPASRSAEIGARFGGQRGRPVLGVGASQDHAPGVRREDDAVLVDVAEELDHPRGARTVVGGERLLELGPVLGHRER